MQADLRWRHGRSGFVVPPHVFDPRRYSVCLIDEADAKAFVTRHHYSRSWPSTILRAGLIEKPAFQAERLVGVASFGLGPPDHVPRCYLGVGYEASTLLNRLVLLDEVGFNAESFFSARAERLLRQHKPHVEAILSYSDPVALPGIGKVGHIGSIYQARSYVCMGRSRPRTIWVSDQGIGVDGMALTKIRTGKRGSDYAARRFRALGAPPQRPGESGADWVRRSLRDGPFEAIRHPGKIVYARGLTRRRAKLIGPGQSYPKRGELGLIG